MSLIGNNSQAEGSIAEGYIVEEALTFCSRYFEGIESRVNRPRRVNDEPNLNEASEMSSIFPSQGKPVGGSLFPLTPLEKTQDHRYVLFNCEAVKPFVDESRDYIRKSARGRKPSTTDIERRVHREFPDWFPNRIMNPDITDTISIDMKFLARGPAPQARKFTAYKINGYKFRVLSREQGLQTQNSGIFLTSSTSCVASGADRNMAETGRRPGRAELYLATHKKKDGSYVNEEAKEICEKIELAMSQSTVDESEASPNDAVGKVLGKEHPGRVRCLGLGATPSTSFRQTSLRVGGIRIQSNDARCSSGCQEKYDQIWNTLKEYMIMKGRSIPEQFFGIFASPPTMQSDAASGSISLMDARSFSSSNPNDNH